MLKDPFICTVEYFFFFNLSERLEGRKNAVAFVIIKRNCPYAKKLGLLVRVVMALCFR